MSFQNRLYPFFNQKISKLHQYLLSALIICVVSAVCFFSFHHLSNEVVALILLLTLSVIAMFFDIYPVLMAALLSALVWDYFFLPPRFSFGIGTTEDQFLLVMYFVIALINAILTSKIRQMEKTARQKEEKAQTLKLYDTLLSSLSHEFRTPIATIVGATDNLISNPLKLSVQDQRNLLSEISTASLRLNRQVENLLNMSRLQSGFIRPRKDWCNVQELICDVLQHLDAELKHHIIRMDLGENLPLVMMDYGLMEQVLYNLLNNAAQYTPQQTLITIRADCRDEALTLVVEDNGKGFPDDETEKVFEKFYRPDNSPAGGTGLGLSIVKGFVEAHDGTVQLLKGSTGGARFLIHLPADKVFA